MKATFDLFAPSEVIAQDGEFAEIGNPEGYIFGFGVYLRATLEDGRRFVGAMLAQVRYMSEVHQLEGAWEAPLARMNAAGAKLCGAWEEIDPAYGSEAYTRQGTEEKNVARERSEN